MYIVKSYSSKEGALTNEMNRMEADGWTVVSVTCYVDKYDYTTVLVTYHK